MARKVPHLPFGILYATFNIWRRENGHKNCLVLRCERQNKSRCAVTGFKRHCKSHTRQRGPPPALRSAPRNRWTPLRPKKRSAYDSRRLAHAAPFKGASISCPREEILRNPYVLVASRAEDGTGGTGVLHRPLDLSCRRVSFVGRQNLAGSAPAGPTGAAPSRNVCATSPCGRPGRDRAETGRRATETRPPERRHEPAPLRRSRRVAPPEGLPAPQAEARRRRGLGCAAACEFQALSSLPRRAALRNIPSQQLTKNLLCQYVSPAHSHARRHAQLLLVLIFRDRSCPRPAPPPHCCVLLEEPSSLAAWRGGAGPDRMPN